MPMPQLNISPEEIEYNPQTCITAGELRSAGIQVPDNIPDQAWIQRHLIRMNSGIGGVSLKEEGLLTLNSSVEFLGPFHWETLISTQS